MGRADEAGMMPGSAQLITDALNETKAPDANIHDAHLVPTGRPARYRINGGPSAAIYTIFSVTMVDMMVCPSTAIALDAAMTRTRDAC